MKIKPIVAVAFILASFATVIAAAFVGTNVRGRSAWERYSADAKQRGVKLSLSEMLPAPVPDAENFAAVPLFANLFSEDKAVAEEAAKAFALPSIEKPAHLCSLGDAQLSDLAGWQAAFVKSGDLPAAGADPAADVLNAIDHRCGPQLAELAEAERRPHAVFPIKWELGFAALLPHLSVIRGAARVHQIRMASHLAQGNTEAAYGDFRRLLRLYRALEKEPTLVTGLVRTAVLGLAESGVWEGLATGKWDAGTLERIQRDLGPFDLLSDCQFAGATDRGGVNDVFDKMSNGKPPFPNSQGLASLSQDPASQFALNAMPYFSGWIGYNQIAINRHHDAFMLRIDPAGERFRNTGKTDWELERVQRSPLKRHFYALYLLTVPAMESVERTYLHAHSLLQMSRLACALERCRAETGAYPERLDALVPKYVEVLPHDVIDGEPLHYRRTGDGHFLIYSVAMNGEDDGGERGEKTSARDHLDWSWRWPSP